MREYLELALVLIGTSASVYFGWSELRGALRVATGRWALALVLPCRRAPRRRLVVQSNLDRILGLAR